MMSVQFEQVWPWPCRERECERERLKKGSGLESVKRMNRMRSQNERCINNSVCVARLREECGTKAYLVTSRNKKGEGMQIQLMTEIRMASTLYILWSLKARTAVIPSFIPCLNLLRAGQGLNIQAFIQGPFSDKVDPNSGQSVMAVCQMPITAFSHGAFQLSVTHK